LSWSACWAQRLRTHRNPVALLLCYLPCALLCRKHLSLKSLYPRRWPGFGCLGILNRRTLSRRGQRKLASVLPLARPASARAAEPLPPTLPRPANAPGAKARFSERRLTVFYGQRGKHLGGSPEGGPTFAALNGGGRLCCCRRGHGQRDQRPAPPADHDLHFSLHPSLPLLRLACLVSHCMFSGASAPPHASGFTWSTSYPGHAPRVLPVDGHG
jgi:hypothetical protein